MFRLSSWAASFAAKDPYPRATLSKPPSPRRLRNPRNFPAQREPAEAQAANAELAQKCARPSAQLAAVVLARGKLRFPRLLL